MKPHVSFAETVAVQVEETPVKTKGAAVPDPTPTKDAPPAAPVDSKMVPKKTILNKLMARDVAPSKNDE